MEQQLLAVRIGQYRLVETFLHGIQIQTSEGDGTLGGPWMQAAMKAGGFPQGGRGQLMLPPPAAAEQRQDG